MPFEVLIAGGGVAGLEASLALRELAGDRMRVTVLAPEAVFVYRPMRIREPFAGPKARAYRWTDIARDIGVQLIRDGFGRLDPQASLVHAQSGQKLPYDALLLAMGARMRPAFSHAVTINDARLDEQLHGLIEDVEQGYVHSIAFLSPSRSSWPLPLYELALMTAQRAYDLRCEVATTLATPEDRPLAIFGAAVSEQAERLLEDSGIALVTSARCSVPAPDQVTFGPSGPTLPVQRVIALPQLFGPAAPGVPRGPAGGFIPIDDHCRVPGLTAVFAAGDATNFPIKHGGIAAQQADVAAQAIAVLAGAPVHAEPLRAQLAGVLLGGKRPLYIRATVSGDHGLQSSATTDPGGAPAKIEAKYLSPYLAAIDRARDPSGLNQGG